LADLSIINFVPPNFKTYTDFKEGVQPKIGKHHYKAEEILKAIGNGKTHEGEAIAKRYMLTTGALWRKDTKRL